MTYFARLCGSIVSFISVRRRLKVLNAKAMRVDPELPSMPTPVKIDEEEEGLSRFTFIISTFVSSLAGIVGVIEAVRLAAAMGLHPAWFIHSASLANVSSEDAIEKSIISISSEISAPFSDVVHPLVTSLTSLATLFCIALLPPGGVIAVLFGDIRSKWLKQTFDAEYACGISAVCLLGCSFAFVINMIFVGGASSSLGDNTVYYLFIGIVQAFVVLLSILLSLTSFLTRRGSMHPRGSPKYETIGSPGFVQKTTWILMSLRRSVLLTLLTLCLLIIDAFFPVKESWRPYFVLIFTLLSSYAVLLNYSVISDYSTFTFVKDSEHDGSPESCDEGQRVEFERQFRSESTWYAQPVKNTKYWWNMESKQVLASRKHKIA